MDRNVEVIIIKPMPSAILKPPLFFKAACFNDILVKFFNNRFTGIPTGTKRSFLA